MTIWIRPDANVQHNIPSIKVNQVLGDKVSDNYCSSSISDEPNILAGKWALGDENLIAVKGFIMRHKGTLLSAWAHEINIVDLKKNFKA